MYYSQFGLAPFYSGAFGGNNFVQSFGASVYPGFSTGYTAYPHAAFTYPAPTFGYQAPAYQASPVFAATQYPAFSYGATVLPRVAEPFTGATWSVLSPGVSAVAPTTFSAFTPGPSTVHFPRFLPSTVNTVPTFNLPAFNPFEASFPPPPPEEALPGAQGEHIPSSFDETPPPPPAEPEPEVVESEQKEERRLTGTATDF